MQFIQCAQAAHPWCVLTLLFSNRILNELPSSYFSEIFSSSALSELYVSMRDPESGIKELKLEKEKKLYNHCFSGITPYIQLNSILFIYCSVKTIKLSQGALKNPVPEPPICIIKAVLRQRIIFIPSQDNLSSFCKSTCGTDGVISGIDVISADFKFNHFEPIRLKHPRLLFLPLTTPLPFSLRLRQ